MLLAFFEEVYKPRECIPEVGHCNMICHIFDRFKLASGITLCRLPFESRIKLGSQEAVLY